MLYVTNIYGGEVYMVYSLQVTSSLQDYLETILSLIRENKTARVTDIAQRLDIAKPSVIKALSLLKEKGLITQDRYGPVELTAQGERYALRIRHRHQVIYGFLTQVLGVSTEAAEKDACLMEHDLSKETFEKLLKYLDTLDIDAGLKQKVGWYYNNLGI
jgi:DtxR family transcriptional regulator, Mn-dependent transcriptional regulator